jgi:hypothetical protein
VRPAGGERGAAVPVGLGWLVVEHVGLVGGVQSGAGEQLGELVPPGGAADLL